MSFNMKPKKVKQSSTGGVNIDYEYIASQVDEGSSLARISQIVDLGIHDQGIAVNENGVTYLESEEDMIELLNAVTDKIGEKQVEEKELDAYDEVDVAYRLNFKIVKDKWVFVYDDETGVDNVTFTEDEDEANELLERALELDSKYKNLKKKGYDKVIVMEDCYKLPFSVFESGKAQEIYVAADLVDTHVQYIESDEDSVRQYRVPLCSIFKGELKGWALNTRKNKKGVDTFDAKTKIAKLAKATGCKSILEDGDDLNNIGMLLGQPFMIDMEVNDSFVKYTGFVSAPKGMDVPELEIEGYEEGIGITFDNATVELLQAAFLNGPTIKRIKAAENYEGSNIQKAIEGWEELRNKPTDNNDDDSEEGEVEEKVKPKKKVTKKKAKPESEESEEDDAPFEVEEDGAEEKPKPKKKATKKVTKKKEPEPEEDEDDSEDDLDW